MIGWGWWMVEFGVAGGYLDGSFDLMVALIYTAGSVDLLIVSLPDTINEVSFSFLFYRH